MSISLSKGEVTDSQQLKREFDAGVSLSKGEVTDSQLDQVALWYPRKSIKGRGD